MHPSRVGLSTAMLTGLRDGLAAGRAQVDADLKTLFLTGFPFHDGWLVTRTGNYGTDYAKRAVVDKIGLGALSSDIAVYPIAQTDMTAQNLTGAKRYVAHMASPPPTEAFWSLTMYAADMFFVPNAIDRYVLNDRSDLHRNADGSIDFYFQRDPPADPQQRKNWLPTPKGDFRVIARLYQVARAALPGVLDGGGWKPPMILPCLVGNATVTGRRCAS
jgi:hypothetical protein